MQRLLGTTALVLAAATPLAVAPFAARAQDADVIVLDEVVVTGQKAARDLQDETASVAVIVPGESGTGADEDLGTAIERIPNVAPLLEVSEFPIVRVDIDRRTALGVDVWI
jgi:outer membrane receptor protein involved in Fe transport